MSLVLGKSPARVTIRFRIWAWARLQSAPVSTRDVMREFKMEMCIASNHLSILCGAGCLTREHIKNVGNRYEYRSVGDCPPQYGMGNPRLQRPRRPTDRAPRLEVGDEFRRVNLSCADLRLLVDGDFLLRARAFECAPLVKVGL